MASEQAETEVWVKAMGSFQKQIYFSFVRRWEITESFFS